MAKTSPQNPASKAPPSLSDRPLAKAFQIDQLLRQVREGAIRIPHFQRPLNWTDSDRLELFDSIYRGYPIGTLLFWKKSAPAQQVSLGKLSIYANERSDALWVVDGQQRITTLAEALLQSPEPKERAIFFDLEKEEFIYKGPAGEKSNAEELQRQMDLWKPPSEQLSNLWEIPSEQLSTAPPSISQPEPVNAIPVAKLLDSNHLVEWALERPTLDPKLRRRAIDAGKRIREYQVPSYIVETDQEDILRTVFVRINQTGHRLEGKDVFHALFASQSPEKPSDLKTLAEGLCRLGFGQVPENEILIALRAVNGLPLHHDFAYELEPSNAPEFLKNTDSALRRAIEFLKNDAQIPHFELLPYKLPLAVLAKFFYLFPNPKRRGRILLRRWLWRGALTQRHAGAALGLQRPLDLIHENDEDASVQRLLPLSGSHPAPGEDAVDHFHFNHAKSKLQSAALASLVPLHVHTQKPIDIGALLSEAHPKTLPQLIHRPPSKMALAGGLANRILHPELGTPSELILALQSTNSRAVLDSHCIGKNAQDALKRENFEAFLTLRGQALEKIVHQYFEKQAEWGADDSPSLASMIIEED